MSSQMRKYELKARAEKQAATRRRIVEATSALHEEVAPARTTVAEIARRAGVQREVTLLQSSVRHALNNIRDLLYGLRGEPAVQLGLVPALRKGLVKTLEEKTGIQISLSVSRDWPRALAADPALHLYRIIQEALNNVVLHAHATSTRVRLEVQGGDQAVVVISDDGRGFPAQPNLHASRFGIVGMRERATLMGGGLKVESSPRGTAVRLTVPLDSLS